MASVLLENSSNSFFKSPQTTHSIADPEENNFAALILKEARTFLYNEDTKRRYRMKSNQFIRKSPLTFARTVSFLMFDSNKSLNTRLNAFFDDGAFDQELCPPTVSALCQARFKVNPFIFQAWNQKLLQFFYTSREHQVPIKRWHGRLLYAIDGTKIRMPDTPSTRRKCQVIQDRFSEAGTVQANFSLLHDVLNKIPIHFMCHGHWSEKEFVLRDHLACCPQDAIVIMDRLYGDYSIVAAFFTAGVDFVIRGKLGVTFLEIMDFLQGSKNEEIVTLRVPPSQKKLIQRQHWPESIRVRLIKVALSNGETEILITSLLDATKYPIEEFKELYFQRWNVETAFGIFKNRLEVERFSGMHEQTIVQDLYAMVFLITLEEFLTLESNNHLATRCREKERKYLYQVKKSAAFSIINKKWVNLFLKLELPAKNVVKGLQHSFIRQTEAVRPGRAYPRKKLTPSQRLNYHLYRKKHV